MVHDTQQISWSVKVCLWPLSLALALALHPILASSVAEAADLDNLSNAELAQLFEVFDGRWRWNYHSN